MIRNFIIILIALFSLQNSLVYGAETSRDWSFTVGARAWLATWNQEYYGASNTGLGFWSNEFDQELILGPSVKFDWKKASVGLSYFKSSSFSTSGAFYSYPPDGSNQLWVVNETSGEREDIDFYISYSFLKYFSVSVGYKQLFLLSKTKHMIADQGRLILNTLDISHSGPAIGLRFFYPFKYGFGFNCQYSHAFLTSDVNLDYNDSQNERWIANDKDKTTAMNYELNIIYQYKHLIALLGYRDYKISEIDPYFHHEYDDGSWQMLSKIRDKFNGPVLTVMYKF